MNKEIMKPYRAEKKSDTWWVVEWPDTVIASFIDSKAFTAEDAAREHADKMNAAYAKKNYNKCCESVIVASTAAEWLEHWFGVTVQQSASQQIRGHRARFQHRGNHRKDALGTQPSQERDRFDPAR